MSGRSFAFLNLGCNANQADAEQIASKLRAGGERRAQSLKTADTLVVMTCAFTAERQAASLRQIEEAIATSARGTVIVSGCLPDINPAALQQFTDLKIIRPRDLDQVGDMEEGEEGLVPAEAFHRIRVSRGCLGRCTFCAIPRATGPLASRPKEDVLRDVARAIQLGQRRIMLAGEDVGAYGRENGDSLGSLLQSILELEADFELRVESVNPHWLSLLLRKTGSMLADPRVSAYWYVPVQAGSNEMLRLMQRPYKVEEFLSSIELLRKLTPRLHLVTDFIIGHPGETVSDVVAIHDLIETALVDYVEIMKFDSHEGTRAATLPYPIPEQEKLHRVAYVVTRFVSYLEARHGENCLRRLGLLPLNTNVKAPDIFRALSGSRFMTQSVLAKESVASLLLEEVSVFGADHSRIDRHIAEICRRIGPPGPVNMPLGTS